MNAAVYWAARTSRGPCISTTDCTWELGRRSATLTSLRKRGGGKAHVQYSQPRPGPRLEFQRTDRRQTEAHETDWHSRTTRLGSVGSTQGQTFSAHGCRSPGW